MNRVAIFLLLLTACGANAGEAGPQKDPAHAQKLQPYIHCDGFAEGVRGVALDQRPANAPPWREVGLDGKTERVSVMDGYRVMYSYPRTYPFANLKAERSEPSRYDLDKSIVTGHFAAIAGGDDNATLVSFSDRGFSGQTLTKKALGGRTLGITQIFSDEDSIIVTVFFLNQAPEHRRFDTYEEFVALRDSFVQGYIECAAANRSASVAAQRP